ncbi:tripartite motif-containing protein 2-like [Watersipora subatra]|uniref:tripartite motif-containing protein 2-like n=1 Tax=Watersipora subatra TaxID=2589382 RepID=UPI00355C5B22
MKENHNLSVSRTCTMMVCRDCIVLAHPASDCHELQELHEVKAEYLISLEQFRIKVDATIREKQSYLSCLRTELDTMEIASEVATQDIDKSFNGLVEVVNTRRQQVKDLLKETYETRHRSVSEQLVETDNQMHTLQAIRDKLDEATSKGQLHDLVNAVSDREIHDTLASMTDNDQLKLGDNYLFYEAKDVEKQLQKFMTAIGEINDLSLLPSRILIDANEAVASLRTTITMQVLAHNGEELPKFPMSMDIIDPAGDEISCTTEDNNDGTYTVRFTPQIAGNHLCTVKFLNYKITSACVSTAVRSNDPVNTLGSMGKEVGKLMYPCSLKIDEEGTIYIVDEGNQRIQKFTKDGDVEVISVAGVNKNARTFDCAIDPETDELICSKVMVEQRKAWADTIQIYSLDGTPKHQFTNSDMKKALYVSVNSLQEIIVPDYHLNMVFIYSHEGELIKSFGQHGSGPGEFKEPAFVCIGKNDDIIISDCRNSRVQVLNKNGEFKYQIGKKGTGKGQLQGPSGVAIDKFGQILVTDRVNNRIQVYTYTGEFVSCIESSGSKLSDPRGLAVSTDGHVYVADQKNHCVKQYRYM